jgi:MYND finger
MVNRKRGRRVVRDGLKNSLNKIQLLVLFYKISLFNQTFSEISYPYSISMSIPKYSIFKKDGSVFVGTKEEIAETICQDLNLPNGSIELADEDEAEVKDGIVLGRIGALCQKTVKTPVSHCANCNTVATLRCSKCRVQRYCCVHCQRADWKKHKLECIKA